jgi:transcriptional regulator with XRE-family HTH domain
VTTAPVRPGPANAGGPAPDWDDLLADIGDRIRAERQARGWPQNALAQRAGLDRATVKRIEAGQATLRGFLMACTALEVDMGYLLSREWRMPVPHPRPLTARQAEVLRVVADGRPLSVAAPQLGMTPEGLASVLSGIYRRLGVADVPRCRRRAAAVQAATSRGFMNAA